jgi:hypothetical protein
MNWNRNSNEAGEGTRLEAEETLRQLAALPAPEDLTDRVHARLHAAQAAPSRRGFWAYWLPAQRFQFAAAATLMLAVAGSTWAVYHRHPQASTATQTVQPAAAPAPAGGGFGTAGRETVPPTLKPILVPPKPTAAPHRKPGAGHAAVKPAPKPAAAMPATTNP